MAKSFDFRTSFWGHKMHGQTFAKVKRTIWQIITGTGKRRYSVMVHAYMPAIGDEVIWNSNKGVRKAVIYDIKGSYGVDDMYTLFVEMTQ